MTMQRLGGAIARLATGTYVVNRYAASAYDGNGRHVIGAPTPMNVKGLIQPLSDRDLQRLPEGERSIDRVVFMTQTQLQTAATGAAKSDVLTYNGKSYEVEEIEPWDAGVYWRCIARKISL